MARLIDSSSEARMIAECADCTRLSCGADPLVDGLLYGRRLDHQLAGVDQHRSTASLLQAVFRSTGLTQLKEDQRSSPSPTPPPR